MKLRKVFPIIAMLLIVFLAGCKKDKDDTPGVPPTVTSTDPVNNTIGIAITSNISAIFDVAMDPSTITIENFTLRQGTTDVLGAVTYTGTTATFTPAANLAANLIYTATITTGAKNTAGDALASNYTFSFTTGGIADVTKPTSISTDPGTTATGVALNKVIAFTFSEPMNPSTINGTTFTLKQGATPVTGVVTYSGTTATFTPTDPLLAGLPYTATITTGATDVAGNALAADIVLTFNTDAAPTVTSTDPANSATSVILNKAVTATFSVPMDPLTLTATTFTIKQGTTPVVGTISYTGSTATFTHSTAFTASVEYTATITTGAKNVPGTPLASDYVWSFTTASTTSSLAVVDLGAAGNYVILAKTAITNIPTSAVTGDLGLSPAATSAVTGFPLTELTGYATSPQVTGKIYAATMAEPTPTNLTTAIGDMETAYTDAAGRTSPDFTELGTGNIGGLTLTPGLYKWASAVTIPTDITISGGPNDVWIFQIAMDLTMSSAKNITLTGGALAKNIFWQVAGMATLGTASHFEGIILSKTDITFQTGASINGRALAQTAVILDGNVVTQPQ